LLRLILLFISLVSKNILAANRKSIFIVLLHFGLVNFKRLKRPAEIEMAKRHGSRSKEQMLLVQSLAVFMH
jgi:hypothetical protein